jgi:hypothetical protein
MTTSRTTTTTTTICQYNATEVRRHYQNKEIAKAVAVDVPRRH